MRENENGLANVSQKELAQCVQLSPSKVSKHIQQLIRFQALEQVNPAHYRVLVKHVWYTPYQDAHVIIEFVSKHPDYIKEYKKQAEMLHIPYIDVQRAWGYIHYAMAKGEING